MSTAPVIDVLTPPAGVHGNVVPLAQLAVSVVVPTRNEAGNVSPLLERLDAALDGLPAEVIVVDDSDDETPGVVRAAAGEVGLPVRLLHRRPAARDGGLSTAVLAGLRAARAPWAVVMDGDLQHPPEVVRQLVKVGVGRDADLVVASRYVGGGTAAGLDGAARSGVSRLTTRAVKTVFPLRLGRISDPMSGFFAVRLAALDVDRLRPIGFKILMEIAVRSPGLRTTEVTFHFGERHSGRSKASAAEGWRFLRHVARLRGRVLREQVSRRPRTRQQQWVRLVRAVGFGLVGLSGVAVNLAAFWLFHLHALHLHYLLAAALATQASTAWNFLLTDTVVFRGAKPGSRTGRGVRFFLMNNLALLGRLPVLAGLTHLGLPALSANAVSLVLLFGVRFLVSDQVIYGRQQPGGLPAPARPAREPVRVVVDLASDPARVDTRVSRRRHSYLPYRYQVAGVVSIGAQIPLPELEYFRAQWVPADQVDIAVRVGDIGRGGPRSRARMTQYLDPPAVRYEEHLGRFGANFRVDLGTPIVVTVGPLMARSPHVVYTNVIEALLRFVMVSRDRMLLHSACLELDGHGLMLSARTDTGKTATVLRLLREHGGRFLSDDMTIIDPTGQARCFPKPLTISQHTLRAVNVNDLTPAEWRMLRLQSRLHSKEGRSVGMLLSRLNLPIMGFNAVTQMLVPPPKYTVDRLVGCPITDTTRVQDLFIIERGTPGMTDLTTPQALHRLIENTDDAYGFPPFHNLAPAVVIGPRDYTQLRHREQDILNSFLQHIRVRTLASDTFGWADQIPQLIQADNHNGAETLNREEPYFALTAKGA
jgi:dolichol-phosphate mannosyltransferase